MALPSAFTEPETRARRERSRRRARTSGLVAAAAATLAISACGSSSSGTTAAASSATTASAASTSAASSPAAATTGSVTPAVTAAATAFLATLDATQKGTVQFAWTNTAQKQRWSNFPAGTYSRAGLKWGDLSTTQQNAWLAIMQASLSTEGYNAFSPNGPPTTRTRKQPANQPFSASSTTTSR